MIYPIFGFFAQSIVPQSTPISGLPWEQITTITSYLRGYVSDFRNISSKIRSYSSDL